MDINTIQWFSALIVAPYKKVNKAFAETLDTIRTVLTQKNIVYVELIEHNANWDNIRQALIGPKLNYVFWVGHANSEVGETREGTFAHITVHGIRRTSFGCWDTRKWWGDRESRVFSWMKSDGPTNPPSPDLPNDWETRGHSMWSLGLWRTKTIKEFWAIGCESGMEYNGLGYNDMAAAIGVYAYKDISGNYTHIYIGNTRVIWTTKLIDRYIGYPSAIAKIIKKHATANLDTALTDCQWTQFELRALWGDDYEKGSDNNKDGYLDNTLWWWPWEIELWRVTAIQ